MACKFPLFGKKPNQPCLDKYQTSEAKKLIEIIDFVIQIKIFQVKWYFTAQQSIEKSNVQLVLTIITIIKYLHCKN